MKRPHLVWGLFIGMVWVARTERGDMPIGISSNPCLSAVAHFLKKMFAQATRSESLLAHHNMKNTGIYVTGFDAYGGKTANSSETLVLRLKKIFKDQIEVKILPTSYDRSKSELKTIFTKNPKVLLMFGYSKSAKGLKLEVLARNNTSSKLPDNDGHILSGEVVLGGPITIHSSIDLEKLVDKAGSIAYLSRNAGGYVCNYAYYLVLYNKVPTIFVHVPKTIDERIVSGAENIVQSFLT